ncbi:MAG: hypothetical protein B7733_16190 [Myxococcales bacterium FL481]|nr:MAG: hypothetical protein B7733_16190 [Myxococcales bacterium FL481]
MHPLFALLWVCVAASAPTPAETAHTSGGPGSPAESPAQPAAAGPEEREIEVDTRSLDPTRPSELHQHPSTRTVVETEQARNRGAASVADALAVAPELRSITGNAGLGSTSTKLNVAGRGVNPRFSARTSVLLDGVPIATAPYGRPQLTLFPLSLFSIAKVDVALGGASLRFGPQTSGGVINLLSRPIPRDATLYSFLQRDHFGDTSLGTAYGGTHGRLGVYVEYAPRFGRGYRRGSDVVAHGGLAKLHYALKRDITLESTTHAYHEDVAVPGGIPPAVYEQDPRANLRPHDRFRGSRGGTSLKVRVHGRDHQELQIVGYAHHTRRNSVLATARHTPDEHLRLQPRRYHATGLEPRFMIRARHRSGAVHDLRFGVRAAYEWASFRGATAPLPGAGQTTETQHDLATIAAASGYVEDRLVLLHADLILTGGLRAEAVSIRRHDRLSGDRGSQIYAAPLPGASIWYAVSPHVGIFAGYGRSFGPPHFLQLAVAEQAEQLRAETADTPEWGLKLHDWRGFDARVTGWLKRFDNLIDVSLDDIDLPGDTLATGIESRLDWRRAGSGRSRAEPHLWLAHAWTRGHVTSGLHRDNQLPWYPRHSLSAGAGLAFAGGAYLSSTVRHDGEYYTDYANTRRAASLGGVGIVPPATLVDLGAGVRTPLTPTRRLEFGAGVLNVFDETWISRTDDRNAGILPQRPRTFFVHLGVTAVVRSRAGRRGASWSSARPRSPRSRPRVARPR